MNHDNMFAVADQIEREPIHYQQTWWISIGFDANPDLSFNQAWEWRHMCGTVCCIAGTAAAMFDDNVSILSVADTAQKALGLSDADIIVTHLFSASPEYHWPEPFCSQWPRYDYTLQDKIERAKVAAAYIRHLVAVDRAKAPESVNA